jgi:hypothetical protein
MIKKRKILHEVYFFKKYYYSLLIIEKYQKLENEKKTTRTVRKTYVGPMIRYQSLSMPVMVLSETNIDENDKIVFLYICKMQCKYNKLFNF